MSEQKLTATLLLSCPDQKGLVARISNFLYEQGGNIIDLDEHVDSGEKHFSLRVAWDMADFTIAPENLHKEFLPLGQEFGAEWSIRLNRTKRRIAIFVSKHDHCLQEILWRSEMGEYDAEVVLIISNHPDLGPLADRYRIPFHVFTISSENREAQEKKELELLDAERIDTIILARYMQVLSPAFVRHHPHRILNIHHSFLPAFAGGNPYKQAYDRGLRSSGPRATT